MSEDRYAAKKHHYLASYRYNYYAVDDMTPGNSGEEVPSGSYPYPVIQFKDRLLAERVQDALNLAFQHGYNWARKESRQSERCEGYSNYPTSSVATWIHNDKRQLVYVKFMAAYQFGARDNPCEEGLAAYCTWLREYVEGNQEPDYDSPFAEFINYALSSVDWYELAQELYEQAGGK
jgi:hypothetical protein